MDQGTLVTLMLYDLLKNRIEFVMYKVQYHAQLHLITYSYRLKNLCKNHSGLKYAIKLILL